MGGDGPEAALPLTEGREGGKDEMAGGRDRAAVGVGAVAAAGLRGPRALRWSPGLRWLLPG